MRWGREDGDGLERSADADELDGEAEHDGEYAEHAYADELDEQLDEYDDGHNDDTLCA